MAFFARKPEDASALANVTPAAIGETPPPMAAGEMPAPIAKLLKMLGFDPAQVVAGMQQMIALGQDIDERLTRIETKLDLLTSDLAELQEDVRAHAREGRPALSARRK